MIFGFTVKFIGTIMDLMIPYLLAYMIDSIAPTGNIKALIFFGFIMVVCSGIGLAGNVIANRMAALVARNTTQKLRSQLFSRITRLSARQTDRFTVPSLESRLTSDTYNVHQMVGMIQRLGVRAPILLIGGIIVTLTLEPVLTLVLISVLPLIGLAVWFISAKGIPLYTKLQKSVDRMVRVVRENAQGIRVIRALTTEGKETARFENVNSAVSADETKAAVTMAATNPLMNLFLNLGLVAVILVGAIRVNSGASEPGKIIAFMTYFTIILNAMLAITRMAVMLSRGTASAGRIAEVLDTPTDATEFPAPEYAETCDTDAVIEFDHVTFSYNGTKNNLEDINLKIPRGGSLGVIGATGSGKSTLVQLLLRFYDVDSGSIKVNGRDVRSYDPKELRSLFGVALQNDFLYMESIRENIGFGRDIDDDAVKKAAEDAQAAQFIEAYDDNYAHELDIKGQNLSGGQRQRVLIARALAADPYILILDDSSSALDYKTDANLRRAITERDVKGARVIVAQRVSSVMSCSLIIVLDEGRIVAAGTHDELLASCDIYREIAQSQMGGAILD
jgi:ATP-binding cassette subfamily B protein